MRRKLVSFRCVLILSSLLLLAMMVFQSTFKRNVNAVNVRQNHEHRAALSVGKTEDNAEPVDSFVKNNNCSNDVIVRNEERRQFLIDRCRNERQAGSQSTLKDSVDTINSADFKYMIADDTHKILFCAVPKVASTNWKRIMLMLTGEMNVTRVEDLASWDVHHRLQKDHLLQLHTLKPSEIRWRLDTYFKFLFVRHPLERVVSAYENKFATVQYSYFQTRFGRRIVRQYRSNPSNESLARGHDVTFDEFVRYLGDYRKGKDNKPLDAHWRPFSELCLPCQVRYDVIGKYETMAEDADYVIKLITSKVKALSNESLPAEIRFPAGLKRTNRTRDVLSRFEGIPADHFRLLTELYDADLKLFGYEYRLQKNGTLSRYHTASRECRHKSHAVSTDNQTSNYTYIANS